MPYLAFGNERVVELFEREAKTAGRLHHENIANVMDAGRTPEGLAYIAMEWIEGATLLDVMNQEGQFPFGRSAEILRQIAAALTVAHKQNVIHRDLKPANVMLVERDGGEQVKVLDFGIAKIAGDTTAVTISAPMGTPHYASPEQFRSGGQLDWRSDIYSLGVILYQMLAGAPPFNAASMHELLQLQMTAPPPPLRKLRPETPMAVEQLLSRLLAKSPDQRPQSVDEVPLLFDRALASADTPFASTAGIESQFTADWTSSTHTGSEFNTPTIPAKTRPATDPAEPAAPRGFPARRKRWIAGAVLLLAILTFPIWWFIFPTSPPLDRPPRLIAVLPFKPLLAEGRDESFEMGMTETLILKLGSLRQARLRPLNAVRKYSRLDQDPLAAGRELWAEAVLDGSIQKAGERIRVSARLLRVQDGTQLWAENFDQPLTDLFVVQDAIAERVARSLAVTLSGAEQQQLSKHSTRSLEAYQLYLEGRHQWQKRTEAGFKKGLEFMEWALRKDPDYALAHAGLASSYGVLSLYGFLPPNFAMPKAEALAKRALMLDESLAEAHVALAIVRAQYDWNWPEAERSLRRALELNPNFPEARHYYALGLAAHERFAEARAELQQAKLLDPASLNIPSAESWLACLTRDYDQALALARQLVAREPEFFPGQLALGNAYLAKGLAEPALSCLQRARALSGNSPTAAGRLGLAYGRAGKTIEARQLLAELKESPNRELAVAWTYLGLGDQELAFEWLRRAVDRRTADLIYLKTDPLYDSLRADSRFDELLRRVGFIL